MHSICIIFAEDKLHLSKKKRENKMDKYIIISPEAKGTFIERLNILYLKVKDYLDYELLSGQRTLQYCKVFLSDSQNQVEDLKNSLLYEEVLSLTACSIVEQPPLDGSKIALLIKTSNTSTPFIFQSLRLTEEEASGCDSYQQTAMLFEKYLQSIDGKNLTMERNLVRTWIYVTHIDVNYQGVVEARNDIFRQHNLTSSTHYIASTGIGGATPVRQASVAIDFLTYPNIQEKDKKYLQALDHLNPTHEYGVAFERGTRLTLPVHQAGNLNNPTYLHQYFISGTASIDKYGKVVYEGDVLRQTGRLLENIGALLKDGDATMNDIQYFIIYLRDISDYHHVDSLMQKLYPHIPRIIVEARVCRPGWLIEMECIAEKTRT